MRTTAPAAQQPPTLSNVSVSGTRSKLTFRGFLDVMDRFRNTIQVAGGAGRVGHTLTLKDNVNPSVRSEMRGLFLQIAYIELIYGMLGLTVLGGIFIFSYCSGRVKTVGWTRVVRDFVGGNHLLHFLAQLVGIATGVIGLISINQDDGKNDLVFIVPILVALSNLLVGASNAKQINKMAQVMSEYSSNVGDSMILPNTPDQLIQQHLMEISRLNRFNRATRMSQTVSPSAPPRHQREGYLSIVSSHDQPNSQEDEGEASAVVDEQSNPGDIVRVVTTEPFSNTVRTRASTDDVDEYDEPHLHFDSRNTPTP